MVEKIDMENHAVAMTLTSNYREPWDVDRRLAELDLTRFGLLRVKSMAMNASANATAFHAANAAGTFAYHEGTWALRHEFVDGATWVVDRSDGIEVIRNDKRKLKVAYSNVDLAGLDEHVPQPRTKKGSGAERASEGLFGWLPQYTPQPLGEWSLYYLMVDGDGTAELTRPTVKAGRFASAIERIHLFDDSDSGGSSIGVGEDSGPVDNFDPQVARK